MMSVYKLALPLLLACYGLAGAAEPSRISVQTLAAGKEVARIMLPIGQQHTVQVEANQVEQDNRGTTHARGNVRVTIRTGGNGGPATTIVGEEIIIKRKVLDTWKPWVLPASAMRRATARSWRGSRLSSPPTAGLERALPARNCRRMLSLS
jgi:hypothetical protein